MAHKNQPPPCPALSVPIAVGKVQQGLLLFHVGRCWHLSTYEQDLFFLIRLWRGSKWTSRTIDGSSLEQLIVLWGRPDEREPLRLARCIPADQEILILSQANPLILN